MLAIEAHFRFSTSVSVGESCASSSQRQYVSSRRTIDVDTTSVVAHLHGPLQCHFIGQLIRATSVVAQNGWRVFGQCCRMFRLCRGCCNTDMIESRRSNVMRCDETRAPIGFGWVQSGWVWVLLCFWLVRSGCVGWFCWFGPVGSLVCMLARSATRPDARCPMIDTCDFAPVRLVQWRCRRRLAHYLYVGPRLMGTSFVGPTQRRALSATRPVGVMIHLVWFALHCNPMALEIGC